MHVDVRCFCVNKHHGTPPGAIYCGRGSDWGNPFRTRQAGGTLAHDEAVAEHEFWLAQPEQAHLLRRIDELRGHKLICFCAPKLCHTNVLAFLANSDRATRIRWWHDMRSRDRRRTIVSHDAWKCFERA